MSQRLRELDIRWYAALTSLLLSVVALIMGDLPNNDAYTYLRTAEIFREEGLAAAFSHYPWAAYPVLIGTLQMLPGLDHFQAAQLLNAVIYVMLTATFISLAREIDSSRRVTILAAIIILAYPHINDFRFHLIRDIAYVAFSLLALLFFLRYYRHADWRRALGFCLATVAAALFRPEALAFLLLAPFALLLQGDQTWRQRLLRFLSLHGITAALTLFTFTLFLLAGVNLLQVLIEGWAIYLPFFQQSVETLFGDPARLSETLFIEHAARFSDQYIALILITGLIAVLLAKIIESFGLLVSGILGYGIYRRLLAVPRRALVPLAAYLLIALGILLAFILITRFMTTRYTLLFCTIGVLWLPLIVNRGWRRAEAAGRLKRFYWIFGLILTYSIMDAHISYGERKAHTREALAWIEEHTDAGAPLLSNEEYIAWQSGRVPAYDEVHREMPPAHFLQAQAGSILVIQREERLLRAMEAAENENRVQLLQSFEDSRGPRIFVYRRL